MSSVLRISALYFLAAMALLPVMAPANAQGIGPLSGAPESRSELPPELLARDYVERPYGDEPAQKEATAQQSPALSNCLSLVKSDPEAAKRYALDNLTASRWDIAADGHQCLGVAESALSNWLEARDHFRRADDLVRAFENDPVVLTKRRASLAAMAGNAALAMGDGVGAVSAFDKAMAIAMGTQAGQGGTESLSGSFIAEIARDYARALVAMNDPIEARDMLAKARAADPQNAEGWLLSATLARRQGDLAAAQAQIQTAARLDPHTPEIALEGGLIAVLSGRDEAARKSWQSVIEISKSGALAEQARAYIAQLDASAPITNSQLGSSVKPTSDTSQNSN